MKIASQTAFIALGTLCTLLFSSSLIAQSGSRGIQTAPPRQSFGTQSPRVIDFSRAGNPTNPQSANAALGTNRQPAAQNPSFAQRSAALAGQVQQRASQFGQNVGGQNAIDFSQAGNQINQSVNSAVDRGRQFANQALSGGGGAVANRIQQAQQTAKQFGQNLQNPGAIDFSRAGDRISQAGNQINQAISGAGQAVQTAQTVNNIKQKGRNLFSQANEAGKNFLQKSLKPFQGKQAFNLPNNLNRKPNFSEALQLTDQSKQNPLANLFQAPKLEKPEWMKKVNEKTKNLFGLNKPQAPAINEWLNRGSGNLNQQSGNALQQFSQGLERTANSITPSQQPTNNWTR